MDGLLLVDFWRERKRKAFVLELVASTPVQVEFARELQREVQAKARDYIAPEPGEHPRWLILPPHAMTALSVARRLGLTIEIVAGEAERELHRLHEKASRGGSQRRSRRDRANPEPPPRSSGGAWGAEAYDLWKTLWEAARLAAEALPGAAAGAAATAPQLDPDFAALHLLPTAPEDVAKAAYRSLSLSMHPDRPGGSDEAMKRLNAAYDAIRAKRGWAAS